VPWRPHRNIRWSVAKPLISFGLHLTLTRWVHTIFMRLDKMILGLVVAVSVLGEYGRAFFVATLPWVVFSDPVTQPFVSALARVNGEDPERVKSLYYRFWRYTLAVPIFVGLMFIPFGGDIVRFLY